MALPMQPAARSILLAYVEHWRKGQPLRVCRGGGRCCLARREWHVLVPKPMAWPRKRRGSCSTYFQRCCPWSFGNDVVVDQRIWTLSSWEERQLRCQRRGWRCPSAGTRSGEPCRRVVGGGAKGQFLRRCSRICCARNRTSDPLSSTTHRRSLRVCAVSALVERQADVRGLHRQQLFHAHHTREQCHAPQGHDQFRASPSKKEPGPSARHPAWSPLHSLGSRPASGIS